MSRKRLLIRVDASKVPGGTGIGHAMRCLVLARAWLARRGTVSVLAADLPHEVGERYRAAGVTVERLPSEVLPGSGADAELTGAEAKHHGASWLVLDGYAFDSAYQEKVAGSAMVMVIDDHGQAGRYQADMILDQNVGSQSDWYVRRPANTALLLGPRFALVAPEFRMAAQRAPGERNHRVVFLLGGAPSAHVIRIAEEAGTELASLGMEVRVVGGKQPGDSRLEWLSTTSSVPDVLLDADLTVAAAGTTTWECCCAGVPAVLFAAASNQEAVGSAASAAGAAVYLGRAEDLESFDVVTKVRALVGDQGVLRTMSRAGRSLIDGGGSERVVDEMWRRSP